MSEDGREERKVRLSWLERVLLRAVYWIGLSLTKVMKVIAILLIFGSLALLAVFVWLLLVTVA